MLFKTNKSFKAKLMMGAILIGGSNTLYAPAIYAQDTSSSSGFDEIIVTATKKGQGENIQDIPLSVTAFDGALIEKLQVRNVQDISYSSPNVALDSSGTVKGLQNFAIRGLGITSSTPGPDPTVGTFVDGIYLGTNLGVILDTFDLESIEVLRGPQGLLFGRNVTGGAVLVNTRAPSHDFSAKLKAGIETGPQYTVAGSITGSVIEDVLSAKFVGYYRNDEGFFTNLANGNDNFGGDETYLLRGAFNLTPAPDLDFTLRLETGSTEGDGPANQNRLFATGHDVNIDNEGLTDLSWNSATLEGNWNIGFGDGVVTTIIGYRELENTSLSDIDSSPESAFDFGLFLDQSQWSAETRYSGSFFDGRWTPTVGAYFFTQDIIYREQREISLLPFFGAPVQLAGDFGGNQLQNTYGLFTSNDFAVTDALTLTLGGRYTFEEKEVEITRFRGAGPQPCVFGSTEPCTIIDFEDSEDWNNFSPKVGLKYDVNDDTQVYGSWSQGFRSGGYNLRIQNASIDPTVVDEESSNAFEFGLKGDFFDDRLRANVAVFSQQIDDLQRTITNSDASQQIENTADVTIQGIEVEATVIVTDNLAVSGYLGLLDGDYTEILFDLTGDGLVNDDDLNLRLPLLADVSAGFSFDYTHDLENGELGLVASYGYRSDAESNDDNQATTTQPERHIINASLAYTTEDGNWTAAVYGKNLANEVLNQTINSFPGFTGPPGPIANAGSIQPVQKGRVIGAEVTYNF